MTKKTKHAAKQAIFKTFREGGVSMMNTLGIPFAVTDTWESMQSAAGYVARHATKQQELGTMLMAQAMWMHGYLECQTMERIGQLATLLENEALKDETADKPAATEDTETKARTLPNATK